MKSYVQAFGALSALTLALSAAAACSAGGKPKDTGDDGAVTGGGSGDGDSLVLPGDGDGDIDVGTQPPTDGCGDSKRDPDEACDDGNLVSDDGCGANCRYIEAGYVCATEGELCRRYAKCGDGSPVFPEQCDDGNVAADDGCSATCKVEIGSKCDGTPSVCSATVCGDGLVEGAETCDDSNVVPIDGCSATCQAEPKCTDAGCTSDCGDGLVLGAEQCDDGNQLDGDGCTSTCQGEDGYACTQEDSCEMVADTCALRLPIFYRDFSSAFADFGVGCGTHTLGVVDDVLSPTGKPTLKSNAGVCIGSATSFAEWYVKSPNNAEILDEIVLFENETGGYVNRLDNEGTRYQRPPPNAGLLWCSNDPDGCAACTPGYVTCHSPCAPWGAESTQTCAEYAADGDPIYIDGNPLFFPIDTHPDALAQKDAAVATIPEEVYGGGWKADPSGIMRNFHFTSEATYWFQYKSGDTANLSFVGDDDVWVFVNRRLAVDLGGLHVPIEGSVAILADGTVNMVHGTAAGVPIEEVSTVAAFGMVDGGVYEIKVFQAERKKTGSSFKLTLSGFNASRSECTSICGDGVLAAGEQCDNGTAENVGGHNGCAADCTLGAYCGDGVVQEGVEQCDDAAVGAPSACMGCRILEEE